MDHNEHFEKYKTLIKGTSFNDPISQEALNELTMAAEEGCAVAQFVLGNVLFSDGRIDEGRKYHRAALEQGYADSGYALYESLYEGGGPGSRYPHPIDMQEGLFCMMRAIVIEEDAGKRPAFMYFKMHEAYWKELNASSQKSDNFAAANSALYYGKKAMESADASGASWIKDEIGYRISMLEDIVKKSTDSSGASNAKKGGCYIATAVYGSYNCPEVWTLRRYRDYELAETWYGRAFIHTYYAISPTIVKLFGKKQWFKNIWRKKLDHMVKVLKNKGFKDTPYNDRTW